MSNLWTYLHDMFKYATPIDRNEIPVFGISDNRSPI